MDEGVLTCVGRRWAGVCLWPLIAEMYSQEILHSDADQIQLYVRLSRDFLDVSKSINVGQDLQQRKDGTTLLACTRIHELAMTHY